MCLHEAEGKAQKMLSRKMMHPAPSSSAVSLEQHITMHQPTGGTTVTSVYRNLGAIVLYQSLCLFLDLCLFPRLCVVLCLFLCIYLHLSLVPCIGLRLSLAPCPFLCICLCLHLSLAPYLYLCICVYLCLFPCLCPYLCLALCPFPYHGNGGSCDDCAQDCHLGAVSLLEYAGFACVADCVHCALAYSPPQRVAGCSHGDVDGDDDGGGDCCYGGDGHCSGHPSYLPLLHPLPPPLCLQAGACGEASGYNPCCTVHPCRQMSDCAGCGWGAPPDGGGGDGGGCAAIFWVHSL